MLPKGSLSKQYSVSDKVQSLLMFKDDPYSFEAFPFWRVILDDERLSHKVDQVNRKLVFKCSRQVGKSVTIGALGCIFSMMYRNFSTIICQPTDKQISQFSVDIMKRFMGESLVMEKWLYDHRKTERQVKKMAVTNGSRVILANIYASVLSIRGASSSFVLFDEIQDIPIENTVIVLNSSRRSPHKFVVYSGTPKSPDNPLEQLWQGSSMNEWMVKCTHCNHWNGPLGGDGTTKKIINIGLKGLICAKCGSRLYAKDGEWVESFPDRPMGGYHINELMVDPSAPGSTSWKEILYRMKTDPIVTVYNEILGVSYADSTHPITNKLIASMCNPDRFYANTIEEIKEMRVSHWPAFAGLDWAMETSPRGGGTVTIKSYTMLTIGQLNMVTNRIDILFRRKYYDMEGFNTDDPDSVVNDIAKWCNAVKVKILGCDYGAGHKENQRLKAILGNDRVMEIQYLGDMGDKYVYSAEGDKWLAPRTVAMTECIDGITNGEFEFAKFTGETSEFVHDLTTVFRYNDPVKRTLRYGKTLPDDWLQNLTYLLLAKIWFQGEFDRFPWISK